ncbi:hypothetical protein CcaCcLH18_14169 [Colletotrichum camelliae]|nr:hypothetical protein CcaCcLH18_14169 [Colletotrichum camelliae]
MADERPPPPPNFIDSFPYRRTPTTANVRQYVQNTVVPAHDERPADASRASAHLLTNLQAEHRLLGSELRSAGVMRPADELAARNLRELVELWPNGAWVPHNYIPPGNLPVSLLKEMLAFSRTVAARFGRNWLPHLWDRAPDAHPAGVLRGQMGNNTFITRQVIRAARHSFFDAPPPPPLPPAPLFAAPVPFAQELAGRLDHRRQVLDEPPAGPPRPPPLPPAPIPAGPLPFAAQLAACLDEICRRRQQDDGLRAILQAAIEAEIARLERLGLDDDLAEDEEIPANIDDHLAGERVEGEEPGFPPLDDDPFWRMIEEEAAAWQEQFRRRQLDGDLIPDVESSDVSEPEQELRAGAPLPDIDELDWDIDPPRAPSPDYWPRTPPPPPIDDEDDLRLSSPASRVPSNHDDRERPDELGLSGSDLDDVAVPPARRRPRPRPYASVDDAVDQVSRGAGSSTSRRLARAANFFTPAQRAAVTREAERATRAIMERFAAENVPAAAAADSSSQDSIESERESEDELA